MTLVGRPAENHPQQVGKRGALDKVDDRRTPQYLWDELDAEFGFTLDVAASFENYKTSNYYDLERNGLRQTWSGVVWCNPPYSDIRPWVEKARYEMDRGCVCPGGDSCGGFFCSPKAIVMLLPANRTEQGWWQDLVEPDRRAGRLETRFLRGRLRFDTPSHNYDAQPKGNRPPFGVVLVIWRSAGERTAAA